MAFDESRYNCWVQRLSEIIPMAADHAALNNDAYRAWQCSHLSPRQVEAFGWAYYTRVRETPMFITGIIAVTPSIEARVEAAKNLSNELGDGDPRRAHRVLCARFWDELLTHISGRRLQPFEERKTPAPEATARFLASNRALVTDESPHLLAGALLAQECHAYGQLVRLYEGARRYQHLFPSDVSFHETAEYFHAHLGAVEKDHQAQAIVGAAVQCTTEAEFGLVEDGFWLFLDQLATFWRDVSQALTEIAESELDER